MDVTLLTYLNTFLWFAAVPAAYFVGKQWVTRLVNHSFDEKLETLRSELREKEEKLKADLREREVTLNTLRTSILSGSAGRQNLLDKRRFEAVEKAWISVNDLAPLKLFAMMMGQVKFKAISKNVSDPKIQKFLDALAVGGVPDPKSLKNVARDERPFLTEQAWLYLSAYRAVLSGSLVRYSALKSQVSEPEKLLDNDSLRKVLKQSLPHHSEFIDKQEPEVFYMLLDELEARLLAELQRVLDGKEVDEVAVKRTTELNKVLSEVLGNNNAGKA